MNTRLLDVDEVMAATRLGRTKTYAYLASGELKSIKLGRRRLVPEDALQAFIEHKIAEHGD